MRIESSILFEVACGLAFLVSVTGLGQTATQDLEQNQFGGNSNWQTGADLEPSGALALDWSVKVGAGRSQIVGTQDVIYVTTGSSESVDNSTRLTTKTIAIDLNTGQLKWSHQSDSVMDDAQETFGGAMASPQATPALIKNHLITLSFTGQLVCHDRADGSVAWEKDLVDEFGAVPAQYGFSSSPVFDPRQPDRFFLMAAGESGGMFCLRVADGSTIWKADCKSWSYATPVLADLSQTQQLLLVTEDQLLGIDRQTGNKTWSYPLPEGGLTNVPTPMVIGNRVILSGQGCQGTRCLIVTKQSDNQWRIRGDWYNPKVQFFYTNWLSLNSDVVIGCTDKYLAALNINDGSILGRWRGFSNGNVVMAGETILLLDGVGNLNLIQPVVDSENEPTIVGLETIQKVNLFNGRFWTPVSIMGNRIIVRGDDQLAAFVFSDEKRSDAQVLDNLLGDTRILEFEAVEQDQKRDPVEMIFVEFESNGQEAALQLYSQLRAENRLNESARIALAVAAKEQGLIDVAKMFLNQAQADFPESKEIQAAIRSILDD